MTTTDYLDFTYWEMKPKDRLKFDVGNIYDNKIQCKLCGWIIRSKNRHNMVTCKCGEVAIDGGQLVSKDRWRSKEYN
jgi:hypothetical protein